MLNKLFGKKTDPQSDTNNAVQEVVQKQEEQPKKKGIIGGLKDKAVEKMLEKQLAKVPTQQREMLMSAIKKNPDFFEKIAKKIKEEQKKNGGNEMAASMKVMREHQGELMKIMMGK